MSRFSRFELVSHSPSSYIKQTSILGPPRTIALNPFFPSFSIVEDELDCALGLLDLAPASPSLFDEFDTITDLIQIDETPFHTSTRRVTRRSGLGDLYLQALSDRVSALELELELGLSRLAREEKSRKKKYTWTAEVKSPENDRKYQWTAEINDGKKGLEKSYKLTAEIQRKGGARVLPVEQKYTIKVSAGGSEEKAKKEKKKKCEKVKEKGTKKTLGSSARIVEIEEPSGHGGIVLRQVFAKRVDKSKGKRKELSPHDAAVLIQKSFRAYLIRRSQALRSLREMAIAKTKLKEIRGVFHNFSYRRLLARDAEERQRFSEKIIVLLLTVDAIEGADLMVRRAKKSMVDELEAMLDVVDPQPPGKSLSIRRRTFDMPDNAINKELAAGVAQVVQMLDNEANTSEAFEACL
ncbi:BAG family molecular chaperone regulator 7 [Striga hermonthica]|uniref:BAG family molecular chaperone regulator 7 n=1 Tax=Striga hermonthica TaxID=68872 RepID=A0A9N7NQ73_STRHE|nr:BAG family molecular chaperone regulator 7 [Striga hermonthica]